jgi:hypothetical protein
MLIRRKKTYATIDKKGRMLCCDAIPPSAPVGRTACA